MGAYPLLASNMTRRSISSSSLSELPPLPPSRAPSTASKVPHETAHADLGADSTHESFEMHLFGESRLEEYEVRSAARIFEQSLPPVDGGRAAWLFVSKYKVVWARSDKPSKKLASAFLVEAIVWGIPYSFGIFLDAYNKDPYIANQPGASQLLPLIGNLSSGIIYCSGKSTSKMGFKLLKCIRPSHIRIYLSISPIQKAPHVDRTDLLCRKPFRSKFCEESS